MIESTGWVEPFIGIPFDANGLTRGGCHCWGLVRLVLAARAGVAVPAYGEVEAGELARVAQCMEADAETAIWVSVPRTGLRGLDVVLMSGSYRQDGRPRRAPVHAGIMVNAELVLHVEQGIDSVMVPIAHPLIAGRIVSFYRHRALA